MHAHLVQPELFSSYVSFLFAKKLVDIKRNKLYVWQNAKIKNFCERNNPFFDAQLHANIVEKIAKRVCSSHLLRAGFHRADWITCGVIL